jgi:hypothetical protein
MFANILATNATITDISTGRLTNDGGTLVLGTESNNYTQFIQNGLEVMRIKTTGEISMANSLSVGRDTASYLLHVGSSTMSSGIVARFTNADGNCNVDPFSGVSCTSDERLKKNIEKTDFSAVEKLNQVAVREYNMLRQVDGSPKQVGFIAQNLETIFPWLVSTDEEGLKSVSYGNMAPVLVQAIQELGKSFFSKEIRTEKFCVGAECFTEADMKEFRTYLDSKKTSSSNTTNTSPSIPSVNVTPDSTPTSTATTSVIQETAMNR